MLFVTDHFNAILSICYKGTQSSIVAFNFSQCHTVKIMNVIIIKFYIHLFHFNRCLNKLVFEAGQGKIVNRHQDLLSQVRLIASTFSPNKSSSKPAFQFYRSWTQIITTGGRGKYSLVKSLCFNVIAAKPPVILLTFLPKGHFGVALGLVLYI